jgi:hypothetical protein
MLYALAPDDGRLALCNHSAQPCSWFVFAGAAGAVSLPTWAFGVALNHDESHLALPTEEGLAWLKLDWSATPQLRVTHHSGTCLAASAVLRPGAPTTEPSGEDLICALMLSASGAPELVWRRSADTAGTWRSTPLPEHMPAEATQAGQWGQALRPATATLVWPGKRGYVRVKSSHSSSEALVSWHPFAPNYEGLPELGPCWRKGNEAWLACRVSKPGIGGKIDYTVCLVPLRDSSAAEHIQCEYGEFFSTGAACFSFEHNHWKTPEAIPHNEEPESTVRLPLLQFAQAKGDLAPWVLLAQCRPGADAPSLRAWLRKPSGTELKLLLRDGNHPEVALAHDGTATFSGADPTQIHLCWFDQHLWLHLPGRAGVLRCRFECRPVSS